MKTTNLLCLCMALCLSALATSETTLQQLKKVNSNWNNVPVFTGALLEQRALTNEVELIQTHLGFVIRYLQQAEHTLSDSQSKARKSCIDKLTAYRNAGAFPQNTFHCNRQPYFIDVFGNYCAVGYLLKETGYDAVAKTISREMNYAYVKEIPKTYIEEWANLYGFTIDELALIQPTYSPMLHCQSDTFFVGKNTATICRLIQNDVVEPGSCVSNSLSNPVFTVLDSTTNGKLSVVQLPNDTFVVYTPNSGFVGLDSLRYEVVYGTGGFCLIRKDTATAFFIVLPTGGTYVSFYPGDANYDGEISNSDFLLLAKNMGEQGPPRTTIGGDCFMRYSQPWNTSFMNYNTASTDADGNGIINDADFDIALNCFTTVDDYMADYGSSLPCRMVFEPYDTTLTAGDSVHLRFTVRNNYGNGSIVPLKAIVSIIYTYNATKLNLANTDPAFHAVPQALPLIKEKSYSKPVANWAYPHCRYSGSMRIDGHPSQSPYTITTDTFAVIGKPILPDSIYIDGSIALRFTQTYALTTSDSVIQIQHSSLVFQASKSPSGITQNVSSVAFSLTPNPASTQLTISISEQHSGSTLTLTDLAGRMVFKSEIANPKSEMSIAELPSGIYLATLTTPNGQRAVRKVMKE